MDHVYGRVEEWTGIVVPRIPSSMAEYIGDSDVTGGPVIRKNKVFADEVRYGRGPLNIGIFLGLVYKE